MDDGVAFAVSLHNGVARESVDATEVEFDTLADFGLDSLSWGEHFVVEAVVGLLKIVVLLGQTVEILLLTAVGIDGIGLGVATLFLAQEEGQVVAGSAIGFVVKRLLLAFDGTFEGLEDNVLVEGIEVALGRFGQAHAHCPAEGVLLGIEDYLFGFAAARDGTK
jgi:hypothetical protein